MINTVIDKDSGLPYDRCFLLLKNVHYIEYLPSVCD